MKPGMIQGLPVVRKPPVESGLAAGVKRRQETADGVSAKKWPGQGQGEITALLEQAGLQLLQKAGITALE
jgi:hypothetical protein